VTLNYQSILERLESLVDGDQVPARYLVAFSGGVDSSLLLHALASTRNQHGLPVVAIHVDHGLHPDSPRWESHCRRIAAQLDVAYLSRKVVVSEDAGFGIEAAAREARYGVMHGIVQRGDWLLSAHHEDDQAETLLLNLFRGSSLAGLAGIGRNRTFGVGRLVRPLLGVSVDAIVGCAREQGLDWIQDPSNQDSRFDRNFLRQTILPELAKRWPAVSARIRQSADLASEARDLLADLAEIDMGLLGSSNKLSTAGLQALSFARQRNVIRFAIRQCGLPPAPATRLYQAVHELVPARADAQPLVRWPGGEMRRHNGFLYILCPAEWQQGAEIPKLLPGDVPLELGAGQGRLTMTKTSGNGISAELAGAGLEVRYRVGGEELRPSGHAHTRKLKKLLQDQSVVPWMRQRIPLLYAGGSLVAVGDLWIAAAAAAEGGFKVRWDGGPALF